LASAEPVAGGAVPDGSDPEGFEPVESIWVVDVAELPFRTFAAVPNAWFDPVFDFAVAALDFGGPAGCRFDAGGGLAAAMRRDDSSAGAVAVAAGAAGAVAVAGAAGAAAAAVGWLSAAAAFVWLSSRLANCDD